MNHYNLKILFLLDKIKTNRQGNAPIRCRITFNGIRKVFSTGLHLNPNHWHSKLQLAKPPNIENTFINNELSLIKNKINQVFLLLQIQENTFTAEDIYNQFKGKPQIKNKSLVEYYDEYLLMYKKLIGIEIKLATWNKFNYILNDLKDFIKWKFNQKDMLLKDLDYSFIIDFEYYLKTEKHQKQVTVNKALQRLKKIVKSAVINKHLDSFPFEEHKAKRVVTNVVYLTTEELRELENYNFSQSRLKQIRDLFIFCCYTGLAYLEMSKLEIKHITTGFDNNKWIQMEREKTQKQISIPILPKAQQIIDKYSSDNNLIFPSVTNQKFNSYLKEIAEIVGIEKRLTHHIARKTFASTILLFNDVPMEIVSELLGHSNMIVTQESYGKVVQKKVSESMINLTKKLN